MLENESFSESSLSDSMVKLIKRSCNGSYTLKIQYGCYFDVGVGNVAIWISFGQVALSVQVRRTGNQHSNLKGAWEGSIRMSVRSAAAISPQRISELVLPKHVWAYSIALDSETNRSDVYVHVRFDLCIQDTIKNFHLRPIPNYWRTHWRGYVECYKSIFAWSARSTML